MASRLDNRAPVGGATASTSDVAQTEASRFSPAGDDSAEEQLGLSDFLLERTLRDDLSEEDAALVNAGLKDPKAKERLDALRAYDAHFVANAPSFDAMLRGSEDGQPDALRREPKVGVLGGVASIAVAAALLIGVWSAVTPDATPLSKGGFLTHFVAAPLSSDDGTKAPVASKTNLVPGERVRFVIDAKDGMHVGVFSLDSANVFTRYAPASDQARGIERAAGKHAFSNSTVLDAVLGSEIWVGVRCQEFVADDVIERQVRADGSPPGGCEFDRLVVYKSAASKASRQ